MKENCLFSYSISCNHPPNSFNSMLHTLHLINVGDRKPISNNTRCISKDISGLQDVELKFSVLHSQLRTLLCSGRGREHVLCSQVQRDSSSESLHYVPICWQPRHRDPAPGSSNGHGQHPIYSMRHLAQATPPLSQLNRRLAQRMLKLFKS